MGHRDASSQEAFFNCLYEERFSKMKRYALILLSNPELAEEVVQDAFLELYLHIDEVMAHEIEGEGQGSETICVPGFGRDSAHFRSRRV